MSDKLKSVKWGCISHFPFTYFALLMVHIYNNSYSSNCSLKWYIASYWYAIKEILRLLIVYSACLYVQSLHFSASDVSVVSALSLALLTWNQLCFFNQEIYMIILGKELGKMIEWAISYFIYCWDKKGNKTTDKQEVIW